MPCGFDEETLALYARRGSPSVALLRRVARRVVSLKLGVGDPAPSRFQISIALCHWSPKVRWLLAASPNDGLFSNDQRPTLKSSRRACAYEEISPSWRPWTSPHAGARPISGDPHPRIGRNSRPGALRPYPRARAGDGRP